MDVPMTDDVLPKRFLYFHFARVCRDTTKPKCSPRYLELLFVSFSQTNSMNK
ncbi:Uncharacterized protein APZ42_002029 [Daphnia magna]|uniref:Uncharacterized protein n=1 Tax=Daphnia magna TaxID=35525 RepID=A0A164IKA1_9CRUS|nr:Uncharacterized protein APZ42_002029 [Daphnia magna]